LFKRFRNDESTTTQNPKTKPKTKKRLEAACWSLRSVSQSVSQSPRTAIQKKTIKLKSIKTKTLFPAEVVEPSSFSKNLEEQEQEQMQQFPSSWTLPQFFLLCTYCANNQKTKQNPQKKPPKFGRVLYFKKAQPTKKEIPPSWQTNVLSKLLLFFEVKYSVCIQLSQHAKDDNEEEEEEEDDDDDDGSLLLFLAFPFLLPSPSSSAAAAASSLLL
jgi:hypothetical protein